MRLFPLPALHATYTFGQVTVIDHQEDPYRRRKTLALFLAAIDPAGKIVDRGPLAFGDFFESRPHLFLQPHGGSAPGDSDIACNQRRSRQGSLALSHAFPSLRVLLLRKGLVINHH